MLEPLSDQQIMLLQTRNESMTWYRLLQDNAKTLRRSASMHGFEALWHCRSKIWTGVGESIEPERLNSAGDGGWECEFDSFLRLELVLRILNIEDNEHRRWKFSATDFDMLMTRGDNIGTWAEVARPRIQEQYGTKPLTVEMGLTHDVLVEWHEAQSVLKLSGTFGVTGRVLNAEESGSLGMFVVVALDWKVKKMLRYADFRSL
ncbi:hypothetical protein QBC44DRAFT_362893 [Cladorrhinum sp. PSN332]|nr:hypothetical protein QBC44DRAFT_362893 [Cladorrhinum sp. PSN332]